MKDDPRNEPLLKTLLIVDDESELLEVLEAIFTNAEWTVKTAQNGRQALEAIASFKPSVILSDINMPELNGIEMLKHLYDRGDDTPVILMSGYRDSEKMKEAWIHCTFDFIDKPFDTRQLVTLAENALEHGHDYVRIARKRYDRLEKKKT
jgi:DNA-binding NtrC family response regulator